MKSKSPKPIFIVFSIIIILVLALLLLPLAFKKQITDIAKTELNKQLKSEVDFETLNINFFSSFPDASVSLKNICIVGKDDFERDTLLNSKKIQVIVNLKSFFSDTGYEVEKIEISDTKVYAHVLKDGRVNWDIMKEKSDKTQKTVDTSPNSIRFKLNDFTIKNSDVIFKQDSVNVLAKLKKINLKLNGDFASDKTSLKTNLTIDRINFWNKDVKLLYRIAFLFDAKIDADFKEKRYTLAENKIKINEIPLSLNGWVALEDSATNVDMKLKTEKVDFKSLLSLVPAIYSKSFKGLKADGNIDFEGYAKGKLKGDSYPAFALKLAVSNGWLQYPSLPKSVRDIQINTHISHLGGLLDNMVVDVSKFAFNVENNPFSATLHLTNPISDPNFAVNAVGKINLGFIKDIYPLDKGIEMKGLLSLNVNALGRMSYLEKSAYESFRFKGNLKANDLFLKTKEFQQPLSVNSSNLIFSDKYLYLTETSVKIGNSDIKGKGKVENYLAYVLRQRTLTGKFSFNSNQLDLNQLLGENNKSGKKETSNSDTTSLSVIEIPKNLNLDLTGYINDLKYQKMAFKNAKAKLTVSNGNLNIQKLNVDAFGGKMNLTGQYSSQDKSKPKVNFDIDLKKISFASIFEQVESLKKIVPLFDNATGNFNSTLSLNTLLSRDMKPNLNSILSQGTFNTKSVALKNVSVLNSLAKELKLDKISELTNLRNIALAFKIENGRLVTKPFNFRIADYKMQLEGFTGLDKTISYKGKLRLPNKLHFGRFQNIGFGVGGTFQNPKIKVDLAETLNEVVQEQKETIVKETKARVNVEREKAIEEARNRANKILEQAKKEGDRVIQVAQVSADSLVAKAKNPIAKELAKRAANELINAAKRKADNLYNKADEESKRLIKEAEDKTKL